MNLQEGAYLCTVIHVRLVIVVFGFCGGRKIKSPRKTLEEKVEHHQQR